MKVLMIDDNPIELQLFSRMLKTVRVEGDVVGCSDGESALKYLNDMAAKGDDSLPDIIFLDLNLPKMTGKQVLAEIKGSPMLKTVPIIVMSTSKDESEIRRCYELHANCYLTKPFDLEEYREFLENIEKFWFSMVQLPKPKFS